MVIFEYAMQMEKDGEEFYRDIALKTENAGVRYILTMLADEEVRHFEILKKIQETPHEPAETKILDNAENVFIQMKQTGQTFDVDVSQIQLYREGQAIEQKSIDFYTEKANEVPQQYQKQIFLKLAAEEKKHYFLLENIIDFVSRPATWLENAEFCHLEEY
jgi:rubrerythrin